MLDLILYNARIATQWPQQPWAEALAIQKGRIIAVGDNDAMLALASPSTSTINLDGALVLPGFADAHIHFYDLARRQAQISLYDAVSLEDLRYRVRNYAATLPPQAWVLGYGWNESAWPDPRFPTRHDLDPITGGRPTALWRTDLHAAIANSAALRAAGIDPDTPNPPAGVIDKDEREQPTGVLREAAITLLQNVIPPLDEAIITANLLNVAADLHKLGIVSVHDQRMDNTIAEGPEALRLYTRLSKQGRLPLRISCNFEKTQVENLIRAGIQSGFGNDWVQVGHIKLFADGSLGSHTAWMLEPFNDTPNDHGIALAPPAMVAEIIQKSHRHGLAVSIHAIGDRANRTTLDIFDEALAAGSATPPLIPHRIEHVITIQPDDYPRLAKMGLVASLQPIHCTDDMIKVDRLWGKRGQNTYLFHSLRETGAVLAFGSDAPVANPNPLWGIHAAVTRQNREGAPEGGWYPQERLSVAAAVEAYTLGPAIAIGQAHQQGRLAPGYLADFVVLDRDIFIISPQEIANAQATMTVVGGEIVYQRK